jgi:4-hydroxy-4-methyl-2-oxoglutarate aldolase
MDCGGRIDGAPWGGNVTREARTRGLEGTVIDGATRDTEDIIALGYPVFVRSATLPHTHGLFYTTCMNSEPVQVGKFPYAVMVAPGDIVVGDADGIVIVPAERAAEILELAKRRHDDDHRLHALLEAGKVHGDPEVNAQVAKSRALEGVEQAEGYRW